MVNLILYESCFEPSLRSNQSVVWMAPQYSHFYHVYQPTDVPTYRNLHTIKSKNIATIKSTYHLEL